MRELLIVVQREFWGRVRTKSFVISTIVTPLFFMGVLLVPVFLTQRGEDRGLRLVIVDESSDGLGFGIATQLNEDPADVSYRVSLVPGNLAAQADSLTALLRSGRTEAYMRVPSDILTGSDVTLWSVDAISGGERSRIRSAISATVQRQRAGEMGIGVDEVRQLLAPVGLNEVRVTDGGEEERSEARIAAALGASFLLYMLIVIYGVHVLRSAQEEKANRISEILISSVSAGKLMLGKVLGVGSTALLQVGIWGVIAFVLIGLPVLPRLGAAPEIRGALRNAIPPGGFVILITFVVLGFFLYATLFAALGAAAETMEDAQRFTMPLTMPLLIPILMSESIVAAPAETTALVLSWIPLTAPLVMPMRWFAGAAGTLEVASSVVWMLLSIGAIGWIAGRIYRAGILNTGKRHGWRDIAGWVRAR